MPRFSRKRVSLAAEDHERRRQMRGLLYVAAAVLIFSILRVGVRQVFTPGWWHLW